MLMMQGVVKFVTEKDLNLGKGISLLNSKLALLTLYSMHL